MLDNGNFEHGDLSTWQDLSRGKAGTQIARRGNCFADLDTREINIRGKFAALLRSDGKNNSTAVLRSSEFIAGEGFAFIALRGIAARPADLSVHDNDNAVQFKVDILDAQSNQSLISLPLKPLLLELEADCPGAARIGQFSSHYISTRAYAGRPIKIQFTQRGIGPGFSLIDQVVRFAKNEQLLFYARPYAQAGISISKAGRPYLDSSGSFNPDKTDTPLSYAWALDDRRYNTAKPCLNDLQAGNYQAILYVMDGQHAVSDDAHLYIDLAEKSPGNSIDPECDSPIPSAKTANRTLDTMQDKRQKKRQEERQKKPLGKSRKADRVQASSGIDPDVRQALLNWQQAWSKRDSNAYIDAYVSDYGPTGKSHASWVADRRWNFKTRQYIKLDISNIEITAQGEQMHARFDQSYQSNTYQGDVKRVLVFVKQDNHWKIKFESNAE